MNYTMRWSGLAGMVEESEFGSGCEYVWKIITEFNEAEI